MRDIPHWMRRACGAEVNEAYAELMDRMADAARRLRLACCVRW